MAATIHSLPVELLEAVCEHNPYIVPDLRLTCRDMYSKSMASFLKHYFNKTPVAVCPDSLRILQEVSLSPALAKGIKTLSFSLNRFWRKDGDGTRAPSDYQRRFLDSGGFETQLRIVLDRLPNCKEIKLEPILLTLGSDPGDGVVDCGLDTEPGESNITKLFFGFRSAVATSQAQVESIDVNYESWPEVWLVELAELFVHRPLPVMTIRCLNLYLGRPGRGLQKPDSHEPERLKANEAFDQVLIHMPNLQQLLLQFDVWTSWLPSSFGLKLERLELNVASEYDDDMAACSATLATALRNTPSLRSLSIYNSQVRDADGAKTVFRDLASVQSLNVVNFAWLTTTGRLCQDVCVKEGCARQKRCNGGVFETKRPAQDLLLWADHVHVHEWNFPMNL